MVALKGISGLHHRGRGPRRERAPLPPDRGVDDGGRGGRRSLLNKDGKQSMFSLLPQCRIMCHGCAMAEFATTSSSSFDPFE